MVLQSAKLYHLQIQVREMFKAANENMSLSAARGINVILLK